MQLKREPHTVEDFAWTQWGKEEVARAAADAAAREKESLAALKTIPIAKRTFENTIAELDRIQNAAQETLLKIDFLMNVSPQEDVRTAAKEASDTLTKDLIELAYDEDIYKAVKEYATRGEQLGGPESKLLHDTLRSYRRMGFDLSPEKRAEVKELSKRISELGTKFQKNINDWKDHILVTREELAGLPEHYIAGLKQDATGKYIVTLDYPDLVPFVEHAKNRDKRRELIDKNSRKGGEENLALLTELINLRTQRAALLGYNDHADYRTEERMAKTGDTVREFLFSLRDRIRPLVERELADLTAFKRQDSGDPQAIIEYCDTAYYDERLKEQRYAIDAQKLQEYFPLEHVKQGMFKLYQTLLGVSFNKINGFPLWHEDVEAYEMHDTDGALLSYFLLDLYPRQGKYSHAAAFNAINGRREGEGAGARYVAPVACMVTNFPKPSASNPSLMSHREVETLLHEFGHVMHHVLTQAAYPSQSGFSAAWDFVEAPSQMLEHWAWEEESLALLAKHYQTGEPLPHEMIERLRASRLHMSGYDAMRQLSFGILDLTIHTQPLEKPLNEIARGIATDLLKIAPSPQSLHPAGFGHMAGGYDCGYYGYLWSRVYAADMYTRFADGKVLDQGVGHDYRQWILERGSSMEEIDLVRGFLGREPNNEAFLKEIGL